MKNKCKHDWKVHIILADTAKIIRYEEHCTICLKERTITTLK